MKTVNTVIHQLTDPTILLHEVRETLRTLDPDYTEEEKQFLQAAAKLEREIGPRAKEYLAALEQEFTSDIIFVGWQGFMLNLNCFTNPVNKLLLREDFEDLHLEHRMPTLPLAQSARCTIDAFLGTLPPEKHHLVSGITSYYSYLQTTAYKLAHYFGFRLADQFLPFVVPGYISDPLLTDQYAWDLQQFFHSTIPIDYIQQ